MPVLGLFLATGVACTHSAIEVATPQPVIVSTQTLIHPLAHGARVKVKSPGLGQGWTQGILSLEGKCVVWLRNSRRSGRYIAIFQLTHASVSNVQREPRGGWPTGVLGPVPGEIWTEVPDDVLGSLQQMCRGVQYSLRT